MSERDIAITAADGWPLAATLFAPPVDIARGDAVLIGPATGVPRRFYGRFARFLAGRGFHVLTVDYRGIGGSAPAGRRRWRFDMRMRHWGEYDLAAAIAWLRQELRPRRLLVVGNSVAGQVLPLAGNADAIDGVLLVGSQLGNWRHWRGRDRLKVLVGWLTITPLAARTIGFVPGWLMGGEGMPSGIALEWVRWGRHRDYLLGHVPGAAERFAAFRAPLRFYSFTDDFYAPHAAVEDLMARYRNAATEHRRLTPADVGLATVGHFGFFRDSAAATLWPEAAAWLENVAGLSPAAASDPVSA